MLGLMKQAVLQKISGTQKVSSLSQTMAHAHAFHFVPTAFPFIRVQQDN